MLIGKMERIKKRKKECKVFNGKNDKNDKFYMFLRKRIVSGFNVPQNIPILTEDKNSFRSIIFFEAKHSKDTKYLTHTFTVRTHTISRLLSIPYIEKRLNVKTILKYKCILLNIKNKYELTGLLVKAYMGDITSIKVSNETPKCLMKPFVFIVNGWDEDINLCKDMDTGIKKTEDPKALVNSTFGFIPVPTTRGAERTDANRPIREHEAIMRSLEDDLAESIDVPLRRRVS